MTVPTVVGSVPANLTRCLNTIGLQASLVRTIQKTVLLSSVHLIRHYINVVTALSFVQDFLFQLYEVRV